MGFLMISNVATLSWGKLRPRRSLRLEVILFFGMVTAGLLAEPWWTLIAISAVYLILLPIGMIAYLRVRRQRAAGVTPPA
jgi:CDP-diacylglycerol--serine O-phosphatidyltransferase